MHRNTPFLLLAKDQLHPSVKMYRMWVEEILPVLKKEISTWEISTD